jgi:hypothetical protein
MVVTEIGRGDDGDGVTGNDLGIRNATGSSFPARVEEEDLGRYHTVQIEHLSRSLF